MVTREFDVVKEGKFYIVRDMVNKTDYGRYDEKEAALIAKSLWEEYYNDVAEAEGAKQ